MLDYSTRAKKGRKKWKQTKTLSNMFLCIFQCFQCCVINCLTSPRTFPVLCPLSPRNNERPGTILSNKSSFAFYQRLLLLEVKVFYFSIIFKIEKLFFRKFTKLMKFVGKFIKFHPLKIMVTSSKSSHCLCLINYEWIQHEKANQN